MVPITGAAPSDTACGVRLLFVIVIVWLLFAIVIAASLSRPISRSLSVSLSLGARG
jgi:hypothetical protein